MVAFQSSLKENVFQCHLRLHNLNLKANLVHEGHLVRLDEASSFHHHRGCLRDQKHFESLECQHVC